MPKPKTAPRTKNTKLNAKQAKQPRSASRVRESKRPPKVTPQSAKTTSKLATLIAMLRRPGGATIADLTSATNWQAHSVRGSISGAIKKKRGLAVTSEKTDGARIYRIEV